MYLYVTYEPVVTIFLLVLFTWPEYLPGMWEAGDKRLEHREENVQIFYTDTGCDVQHRYQLDKVFSTELWQL